jgi:hypothetical protein
MSRVGTVDPTCFGGGYFNRPLAKVELTAQTTSRFAINPPETEGRSLTPKY